MLILVIFLFAFSSVRNSQRKVSGPYIEFLGEENLYITHENVSKLLIQNQGSAINKPKEIIDLNELETALNSNQMIQEAQVFMSVDGTLTAQVKQKKPVARVSTEASYYVDEQGSYMPLSTNFAARVPLVTGFVDENELKNICTLAKKIQNDEFLKSHVVQIHQNENETFDLKLRKNDFTVQLGTLNQLDKKINNLKVFYQKGLKDEVLNKYSVINLKFDNQVICTKKVNNGS